MGFVLTAITVAITFSCRTISDASESELDGIQTSRESTLPGIGLSNSHAVITEGTTPRILRSKAPVSPQDYADLQSLNLTDVVIFKNETRNEVKDEIKKLKDMGIDSRRISHVPFPYKQFPDFETPCRQTIDAIKAIKTARRGRNRVVLFHCTVGEDRTGYLAGLIAQLEGTRNHAEAFKEDLCKKGYSSGNTGKPANVTRMIDRDLTPLYLKMSYLIVENRLSWEHLDADALCVTDPSEEIDFSENPHFSNAEQFRCR